MRHSANRTAYDARRAALWQSLRSDAPLSELHALEYDLQRLLSMCSALCRAAEREQPKED